MSQREILRNIYSFLEVLQTSSTNAVGHWDRHALDNALKWAAYSEQVWRQSQGKSYEQDLRERVEQFSHLPWALGAHKVNFDLLGNATSTLKQTLLQNPCLSADLSEVLLQSYTNSDQLEHFFNDCHSLCIAQSAVDICHDTLFVDQENISSSDLEISVLAKLVLRYVQDSLMKIKPSIKERSEDKIKSRLKEVLQKEQGVAVLLTATISTDTSSGKPGASLEANNFILNCVLEVQSSDAAIQKKMWSLSAQLLISVSAIHHRFYLAFRDYLTQCAKHLQLEYSPEFICRWRKKPGAILSYDDICQHIKNLTKEEGPLSSEIRTAIEKLAEEGCHTVWASVMRDVLEGKR